MSRMMDVENHPPIAHHFKGGESKKRSLSLFCVPLLMAEVFDRVVLHEIQEDWAGDKDGYNREYEEKQG